MHFVHIDLVKTSTREILENASPKSSLNPDCVFFWWKTDSWRVGTTWDNISWFPWQFFHFFFTTVVSDESDGFLLLNPCL